MMFPRDLRTSRGYGLGKAPEASLESAGEPAELRSQQGAHQRPAAFFVAMGFVASGLKGFFDHEFESRSRLRWLGASGRRIL